MQPIQAIYKFGNLYDKDTKKHILVEDGSEISITIQYLLSQDPNLKPEKLLNATEKEAEINAFISKEKHWKLFNSGKNYISKYPQALKKVTQGMRAFGGCLRLNYSKTFTFITKNQM